MQYKVIGGCVLLILCMMMGTKINDINPDNHITIDRCYSNSSKAREVYNFDKMYVEKKNNRITDKVKKKTKSLR